MQHFRITNKKRENWSRQRTHQLCARPIFITVMFGFDARFKDIKKRSFIAVSKTIILTTIKNSLSLSRNSDFQATPSTTSNSLTSECRLRLRSPILSVEMRFSHGPEEADKYHPTQSLKIEDTEQNPGSFNLWGPTNFKHGNLDLTRMFSVLENPFSLRMTLFRRFILPNAANVSKSRASPQRDPATHNL